MNKIQEEHYAVKYALNKLGTSNEHTEVTIKHMKGFAEWLIWKPYKMIRRGEWMNMDKSIGEDNYYTTEQLIEEYIKQL